MQLPGAREVCPFGTDLCFPLDATLSIQIESAASLIRTRFMECIPLEFWGKLDKTQMKQVLGSTALRRVKCAIARRNFCLRMEEQSGLLCLSMLLELKGVMIASRVRYVLTKFRGAGLGASRETLLVRLSRTWALMRPRLMCSSRPFALKSRLCMSS